METAFSNKTNARKFLFTCYSYLPKWDQSGSIGFLAGDEHWLIPKGTGFIDQRLSLNAWEIGRGEQNSNDPYQNYWDGLNGGTNLWTAIRDCNIFLENIDKPLDLQQYERNRWIAEVKFLKAYYHYYLFMLYGPIPVMDNNISIDASAEEVRRYRDPVDDVVNYISNLLDDAAKDLPLQVTDAGEELGRITQPIAKAVKAQLWLLAASPLFNGNTDYINVKDNQGRSLFPAETDNNKWEQAADAALDAIKCAKEAGHDLYYFTLPVNGLSDATRKLLDIGEAVTEKWNTEIIWGSTWNVNGLQKVAVAKTTKGSHYDAISVMAPTLTVAEQFYSSNGVPISEDKGDFWSKNYPNRYEFTIIPDEGNNKHYLKIGEETAYLHLNREPRFYANLSFDRGTWYGYGYASDEPKDLAFYKFRAKEVSGRITSEDYSYTGYLNKKVCSYKTSVTDNGLSTERYAFPIIRLADLYLMYAEALNETLSSPNSDVYTYIDLVRKRAGLDGVKESWQKYSKYPEKPNTKTGMREIIRMERLNELACEGKRFWDLRRWKKELPREVKGWYVQGETAQEFYRVTTLYLRSRYSFKDYLWPLKVETVLKDPNLGQSPGW
jgi:outer membrane protein